MKKGKGEVIRGMISLAGEGCVCLPTLNVLIDASHCPELLDNIQD